MKSLLSKLTFWKLTAAFLILAGVYSTIIRFVKGLGASTHLSDNFPWGLWIGFDVLCGVGLAAGGFTLASIVYIFNIKKYEPIIRPTILTAFLGYLLVIIGLMFDLGRPLQIWHAIIMWNPRSVMFEVAWCVMLYTTVLALEFAPVVLERFKMTKTIGLLKKITMPVIILGVLLSTLHQSSLGSLYLIVPYKLYALWYSPLLPVFFWVSAIAVGCAMVIFESFLSARAFKRGLEMDLLSDVARIAVVMLGVYLMLKFMDLYNRHLLGLLFVRRNETYFYWIEIVFGVITPMILLASVRVRRNPTGLFAGSSMIVLGFILNRMNITITGFESYAGQHYFPSWMELSVTIAIVTGGFVAFSLATKYLNIFEHGAEHQDVEAKVIPGSAQEDLSMAS
jgi:Ni/Fe-hydrogenase subunit HybB-like protein